MAAQAKQQHPHAAFAPAPLGTSVRLATFLLCAILAVACAIPWIEAAWTNKPAPWPAAFLPVLLALVLGAVWTGMRIRGYDISDGELRVLRRFRNLSIPIEGLAEAVVDRDALAGAFRTAGNGGFGAISGRFRSRKLGKFRAYVSDGERAVVLRWRDQRVVVVSPERPQEFIQTLRQLTAGTAH